MYEGPSTLDNSATNRTLPLHYTRQKVPIKWILLTTIG